MYLNHRIDRINFFRRTFSAAKLALIAAGFLLAWMGGFAGTATVHAAQTIPARATEYYVATNGDDGNPGTESRPWQTLSKAAATLQAGDTVYIKEGTYRDVLWLTRSGTAGQYITYHAYPGHMVILDGGQQAKGESTRGLIDVRGQSYIKIIGLKVINSGYYGIRVIDSDHVLLKDNQTDFTFSSGIFVSNSQHITVDGNDIQRACHGLGGEPPHYAPAEHLTIRATEHFAVMNNTIHNSYVLDGERRGKEGLSIKSGSADGKVYNNRIDGIRRTGLHVDGFDKFVRNVEIYGNVVSDSLHGIVVASEKGGPVEAVKVYNNVFYENTHYGIWITGYHAGGPIRNVSLVNNTTYANGNKGIKVTSVNLTDLVIRNNVAVQNSSEQIYIDSEVDPNQVTLDHNFVSGDPLFVDPAAADFRLQSASPAVDSGSSVEAPRFDLMGWARPLGDGFDIGAYEYSAASPALFLPLLRR